MNVKETEPEVSTMTALFTTLPGLFQHITRTYQNPVMLACKKDDAWVKFSTAEVVNIVCKIGAGLLELGLRPGDRIGIAANSSPYWMMMDFAALGCGAITVPLFSNIAPENLRYEIQDSGMRFLFVDSEKQYDTVKASGGIVERFIALPGDMNLSDCISWDSLMSLGEKRMASQPGEWERLSNDVRSTSTATIIYTSGSTGTPKGVELTHDNLVTQVQGTALRFPLDPKNDCVLSCLPLAHGFERMAAFYYLSTGSSLYFAEEVKKVGEALREVHPTVITLVPRLLEKTYARMRSGADSAKGFKKILAQAAFKRAWEKIPGVPATLKDKLFDALVYRKLREALGGRLRFIISGSAPLDHSLYGFLLNAGFPVYEGYGLTETSPVIAANYPGHLKVGTVGKLFPDVEVRIGEDGEILARGPGIMKGYYGKPGETAKTIDENGWLHTGDLGKLDAEGFLHITGRKKELFKTANGKYVAPVPIEQALCNKLADMAMVIAEKRPFVTAVLFPDMEGLKRLKPELGCAEMDDASFLHSEQARAYMQKAVDDMNTKLNHWEKVQKFHLADRILSVDAAELTPTLKIRRHVVEEKFRAEIDAMYAA
jgi:long-chain acyl-CoA synthetase